MAFLKITKPGPDDELTRGIIEGFAGVLLASAVMAGHEEHLYRPASMSPEDWLRAMEDLDNALGSTGAKYHLERCDCDDRVTAKKHNRPANALLN
jgi:hypothetical protein